MEEIRNCVVVLILCVATFKWGIKLMANFTEKIKQDNNIPEEHKNDRCEWEWSLRMQHQLIMGMFIFPVLFGILAGFFLIQNIFNAIF